MLLFYDSSAITNIVNEDCTAAVHRINGIAYSHDNLLDASHVHAVRGKLTLRNNPFIPVAPAYCYYYRSIYIMAVATFAFKSYIKLFNDSAAPPPSCSMGGYCPWSCALKPYKELNFCYDSLNNRNYVVIDSTFYSKIINRKDMTQKKFL